MTTATEGFLQSADTAEVAYILWLDGLALGFTTHHDVEGLAEAWRDATGGAFGDDLHTGLRIDGAVERSIEIFRAKVDPQALTFSIQDDDDILIPQLFGVSRPTIRSTLLAATMDADATTMTVVDASQLSGMPILYLGLETLRPTGLVGNTFAVNRGQWALYPKVGTDQWARTHEVDADAVEDGPEVTDAPVNWLNRPVGLYACHRVNGVWSAGFPDTVDNDAALLFAGRLKHWREAEGWVQLECLEITELLQTSIGVRMYEGTLQEGGYVDASKAEIQLRMSLRHYTGSGVSWSVAQVWGGPKYVAQLTTITDTRASHAEIATAVNAALTTALTGGNDGVYGPSGMVGELSGPPIETDGRYHLFFTWDDAPALDVNNIVVGTVDLYLSPFVWNVLGFNRNRGSRQDAEDAVGGQVTPVAVGRFQDTVWRAVGEEPPKRFMIDFDMADSTVEQIAVTPSTNGTFALQQESSLPGYGTTRAYADGAVGFLMLGTAGKVVAVQPVGVNTFSLRGFVGQDFQRAREGGGIVSGDNELSEFLWAYDDGGPAIPVRQVWIESTTAATAMLKVLSSTGTPGYNVPLYDVLPIGMGVGFPAPIMNVATIIALGNMPYLLVVLGPTPFTKPFQALLNVLGKHAVWANGALTIVDPINGTDEPVVLDESNKAKALADDLSDAGEPVEEITASDLNPDEIINRISLRYGQQLGGGWASQLNVNAKRSQSEFGTVNAAVLDGWGIQADGAAYWAANVAAAAVTYFSRPVAECERSIDLSLATRLYPGCRVAVTDAAIIDPATGTRGVTGLLAWVVGVTFDWTTGVGSVRFVYQPRSAG